MAIIRHYANKHNLFGNNEAEKLRADTVSLAFSNNFYFDKINLYMNFR